MSSYITLIYTTGNKITMSGGLGNDTILNNASSVSISAGDGNDSIVVGLYGDSTTVSGGKGNDIINLASGNGVIDTIRYKRWQ